MGWRVSSGDTGAASMTGRAMQKSLRYRCGSVWLDDRPSGPVDVVVRDGTIVAIEPLSVVDPAPDDVVERLPGLVLPGFADAHSHLFHRALRGRTHAGGGSFWTWREAMYSLAGRLDPDRFRALAVAVQTELVCAGYTAVGEFHYLHHGRDGVPYAEPNALGLSIFEAAELTGIRVTLLDTLYLSGGFSRPLSRTQQRFSDGSVAAWAERVAALDGHQGDRGTVGAAVHSVRAVPPSALGRARRAIGDRVTHIHLSEQPQENEDCLRVTGATPTALLDGAGLLGPRTSVVHATHLTAADAAALGRNGVTAVICPSTEADLADGLADIGGMVSAGVRLACGGDQQVQVDPFTQARGIEWGERLATGFRGTVSPCELVRAATATSHRSIGSPAGRIAVGEPADLVAVRTDTARTAGSDPAQLVMSASAADVAVVVIDGEVIARDGVHVRLGDPGVLLAVAIADAWE